jgi:predicted membrane channel-forming protein YqfA (hemolysin III family)
MPPVARVAAAAAADADAAAAVSPRRCTILTAANIFVFLLSLFLCFLVSFRGGSLWRVAVSVEDRTSTVLLRRWCRVIRFVL